MSSWIQTYTGLVFYPLNPRLEDINIVDIAHALSNLCRFTGHVDKFYSVAEHSVYISRSVPADLALQGLLHDASEAYLSDIARPVKPFLTNYLRIEAKLMQMISDRFGVKFPFSDEVKNADLQILLNERNTLMKIPPMSWEISGEPLPNIIIRAYPPEVAERLFLNRFYELYK